MDLDEALRQSQPYLAVAVFVEAVVYFAFKRKNEPRTQVVLGVFAVTFALLVIAAVVPILLQAR